MQTFAKKTDAASINLVYEMSSNDDYKEIGPSYRHPQREVEKPTGLDSYPTIFSHSVLTNKVQINCLLTLINS